MKIAITVYKDQGGLYPDGDLRIIEGDFYVGQVGYVSLVDANDIQIDYSRPYKMVTAVDMFNGDRLYVGETPEEIYAKFDLHNGSTQTVELTIGGTGPLSVPVGNVVTMPAVVPDNADILFYSIATVPIENSDVVFTSPRTYDFTAVGGLVSGKLKLIFNT
jgi:hypothetical protein